MLLAGPAPRPAVAARLCGAGRRAPAHRHLVSHSDDCVDDRRDSLGTPRAVEIATSGQWEGQRFGLTGGLGPDRNHAKIGVSTREGAKYIIFGDMNQQGALAQGAERTWASGLRLRGPLLHCGAAGLACGRDALDAWRH